MEWLAGNRVALNPRPLRRGDAALEVALLGHCPGRVDLERFLALEDALDDMRRVGFGPRVASIECGCDPDLYHLPLPLHSAAEFSDIFPDAHREDDDCYARYHSVLAGRGAWLAQAVEAFFANGGEKLWVVRIPEAEAQAGFLPAPDTVPHASETLRGLATVLVIPSLAVVALPDLERLQIPARLPDVPRNRLDNPDPQFLPCAQSLADDHRERRYPTEMELLPEPWPMGNLLSGLLGWMGRERPDLTCLLTLPLDYSGALGGPVADPAALAWIDQMRNGDDAPRLRQAQFLFPYLRGPRHGLRSPVGVVAGLQAAAARRGGPWRSMAAQPMRTDAWPYPGQSLAQTLRLREAPGVGVIQARNGILSLDDERLAVPALHPDDYLPAADRTRFDAFRSAEIGRFLGFLRRQLLALGETLVFAADYRDPRPRLILEQFLRRLHTLGALRGALPEDAFQIREAHTQEGVLAYEIMVAPAFPIDRLRLTFANRDGAWQTEVAGV